MKGVVDVNGNPAYRGRSSGKFPTIELTRDAHKLATDYEVAWRAQYRRANGVKKIDWTEVSVREVLAMGEGAMDAAGVPRSVQSEYLGKVNNWLYSKFCP